MQGLEHVAEERLEDFARRECLPEADFDEVREHVACCALCQERLSEINEFVAFMRANPCDTVGQALCRHQTAQGTVFLVVDGADAHGWEARVLGAGIYTVSEFLRGSRAKAFLERWFAVTYGDHRCGTGCSATWK